MRNAADILREKPTAEAYSISPEATVYEALKIMADKDIGALLVLDSGKLAGMFSERDYARKVILRGRHSQDTLVREIMITEVVTVEPGRNLKECLELITNHRIRHLPVMENDRVAGIISIGDIVKGIVTHHEFMIEQLEDYIKGWY
jgi:CBS domain-containing protein